MIAVLRGSCVAVSSTRPRWSPTRRYGEMAKLWRKSNTLLNRHADSAGSLDPRPNLRLMGSTRSGSNPPERVAKPVLGGTYVLEAEHRPDGGFGRRNFRSGSAGGCTVGQGRRIGGFTRQSGTPPATPRP